MRGITIYDSENNLLSFDLIDLLNTIGEKTARSLWKISGVEANGNSADRLHALSDDNGVISGAELIGIASDLIQVIEGTFVAYLDDQEPWLLIRAVDSSEYDVETDDPLVFERLRRKFSDIAPIPE